MPDNHAENRGSDPAEALSASREREAALREILQVIRQSRDDEKPVFDMILDNAARLCSAPLAAVGLVDRTRMQYNLVASLGARSEFMESPGAQNVPLDSPAAAARAIRTMQPVHIDDMADDDLYRQGHPVRVATVELEGARTFLAVPLIQEGRGIGVIILYRREVRPFAAAEIALVETFAEQAVIAIEKVRQFREVQVRLEREAATREILSVISRSPDDELPVFDVILKNACRLCGSQLAFMAQLDETGEYVVCPAQLGTSPEFAAVLEQHRTPLATSPLGSAVSMRERRVVRIDDIADDELYRSGNESRVFMVETEGIRSLLVVPLISGERGIGAILLYRREVDPFTDEDAALVQTFAAQAVIAIENVRQFRDVQTRLEREAATRQVLQVISENRDDEMPVFRAILERAMALCDARGSGLQLVNEERTQLRYIISSGEDKGSFVPGKVTWDLDEPYGQCVAVREARTVHFEDLKDTDLYRSGDPGRVKLVDVEGVRSFLHVPLLKNGIAFGNISLSRREPRPFSSDEIALIETFAAQAVIAIENVRQFRELRVRLEREAATGEVLQIISQSRDDEMPVFEAILERAARLCQAQSAGLQLVNKERTHLRFVVGWGADKSSFKPGEEFDLNGPLGLATAAREARVVQIEDLKDGQLYREGHPQRVKLVDEEGVRTQLSVPLLKDGIAFGTMTLSRQKAKAFSADQIALVETFAAQAVIAIENVRQYREVQERLEREAATREILQVMNQSRSDTAPVFQAILENARRLCDAPMAMLSVANEDRTRVAVPASLGARDDFAEALKGFDHSIDENLIAVRPIADGQIIHMADCRDDDLYRDGHPTRLLLADVEGVRSILAVPMIRNGSGIGAIILYRREVQPFDPDQIDLVKSFAEQAAIALENVRQFREVQARLEREAASREILQVISESRDDEQPVFDAILRNASRLCNAPIAWLMLADDERRNFIFTAVHGDELQAMRIGEAFSLDSPYQIAQTIREGRTTEIPDLVETEFYRNREPVYVKLVEDEGLRSRINVPLIQGGKAIGCIVLSRREVDRFSGDEIALLETFAAQAVIAIENVRQFRELQTRLRREKASAEVLELISRSRADDNPVFDAILENATRLCHAPLAFLSLVDETGTTLSIPAHRGARPEMQDTFAELRLPLTEAGIVSAHAVREGRIIRIDDMSTDTQFDRSDPHRARLIDVEGVRSYLVVPMLRGETCLGTLNLYRRDVDPFSDDDVTLAETFARQAVIAIENVRQFREVQERLERERASAEILEVISQSRDDETPVFDVMLKRAAELCGAHAAALAMGQAGDTHQRMAASYGVDEKTLAVYEAGEVSMNPEISLAAKAILTGEVVHVPDMAETDGYRQGVSHFATVVDDTGIRTNLFVPLMTTSGGIGVLILFRKEVKPYTADEIALVETFAAQAVIAIENVRQFRELQERLAREAATREILQVINQSRNDYTPVFNAILENAARLCDAPVAGLHLVNDTHTRHKLECVWGADPGLTEVGEDFDLESPLQVATCIRESRIIHTPDLADDRLYREGNPVRVKLVDEEGVRTFLSVPLVKDGVAFGCFNLNRREVKPFSQADIELMETFAEQAVVAIENVRQFKALEDRTAEVESLNAGLEERVAKQVGEIERMGRLKRFLSPAVADAVVSAGDDRILGSHRALIATLFCDIRGFTAFCETAEPEETIEVLQTYHEAMGVLIAEHGAGVDTRAGDGIMVIFNDPLPCDDPTGDALRLAFAMRERMTELCQSWKRLGHRLGFGVGISLGYATVGMVGASGRYDYTASGTAVNLAARLCDHAQDGEILLSPRAYTAVEDTIEAEAVGELEFKGIRTPVAVYRALGRRGPTT